MDLYGRETIFRPPLANRSWISFRSSPVSSDMEFLRGGFAEGIGTGVVGRGRGRTGGGQREPGRERGGNEG